MERRTFRQRKAKCHHDGPGWRYQWPSKGQWMLLHPGYVTFSCKCGETIGLSMDVIDENGETVEPHECHGCCHKYQAIFTGCKGKG